MKKSIKLFGIAALVALASVVLIGLSHNWFVHELVTGQRAMVRSKLETYRTIYTHAGMGSEGAQALRLQIAAESPYEQVSSFVEVLSAQGKLDLFQAPNSKKEVEFLSPLMQPNMPSSRQEWLRLPSSEAHMLWVIERAPMPDGATMFVGRLIQNFSERKQSS